VTRKERIVGSETKNTAAAAEMERRVGRPTDAKASGADDRPRGTLSGPGALQMTYFCRLCGLGFVGWRTGVRTAAVDLSLAAVNLSYGLYAYYRLMSHLFTHMPDMVDLSALIFVVRMHVRFVAPLLTMVLFRLNSAAVAECLEIIDGPPSATQPPPRSRRRRRRRRRGLRPRGSSSGW